MSMNRETEMLLQSGIAAVRGGDKREGARLLAQVVRREPQSEDAWFWLAAATDQPAEAAACLRRVLAINPNNSRARQALEMLDSGQTNTAFSGVTGGPGSPDAAPLRPLNTGELLSPPSTFNPPPPPPPFSTGPTPTPGLGGASVAPPPPPGFGAPSWAQSEAGSPPRPPLPGDPYSTASAPSSIPQSNLPPPPPFTGGGVRLGQLDPEAAAAQAAAPQQAGPAIYDPGAELRASLMPNIPPPQQGAPQPVQPPPARPARRGLFQRRGANAIPAAAPTVIVNNNQQRRRVRPLFLALAILAIFVAAIAGILLWQKFGPGSNTATTEAGVTTTVDTTAGTSPGASPGGTLTGGAAGTGAAGTGVAGTGAAGTGAAGTGNGTVVAGNGAGGTSGPGSLTTTPRPGSTTAAGNQPNTTPGTGTAGLTPGSLPPGGTTGGSAALTPTPSQGASSTTAGAGTVVPGLTATAQPPALTTVAPTTFTDQPPTTPAVTVPGGTLVPVTTAPGQATPVTAGEPPPAEVQKYLANTNTYLTYSQYFEMAVAEGIVKPYRAGQIKPGVTRINWPAITYYYIRPTIASSTTAAATTTATGTTATATTTTATTTTATVTNSDGQAGASGTATTTAATTTAVTTPAVTTASTTAAAGTTAAPSTTAVPPNFTGIPIVIDGPEGPQVYIYYGGANQYEVSLMTMSIGRLARIMKDQPIPRDAYELNQVALEYANDLSGIANALDLFFQSGQITYLDQVSILYDKAVRDRTRWSNIVDSGYPYRITQ